MFSAPLSKQTLRLSLKEKRRALSRKEQEEKSGQICQNLTLFLEGRAVSTLAGYYPVHHEASVVEGLQVLEKQGWKIALPVVEKPKHPLIFKRWQTREPLVKGAFNIPEPATSAPCVIPEIVLVPLLGFDKQGYRLGYGGGFYDRTLALLRKNAPHVMAIGIAYEVQKISGNMPVDQYDEKLDVVITDKEACQSVSGSS